MSNKLQELIGSSESRPSSSLQNMLKGRKVILDSPKPPAKKQKHFLRFLDVEASQSSGASADDEEEEDGEVSNLFASQENLSATPGDYLAFHFEQELRKESLLFSAKQRVARKPLQRTMSTPVKVQETKGKVRVLREARNRRISLSEPESPIQKLPRKFNRLQATTDLPNKYRLSLESPWEDFKLVSPKTTAIKQKFAFVERCQEARKPLVLPNSKPFPALAFVKK